MQRSSLVALLIAMTMQGCGYKGPLYLPKEEPAKPAASQPKTEQPAHPQDNKQ